MAFQVSPGVEVKEIDLTTIVPAVSTTATGFAGFFEYGPIGQRITVNNVNDLRRLFRDPSNLNASSWFTAANFLGYGGNLKVVRVVMKLHPKTQVIQPASWLKTRIITKHLQVLMVLLLLHLVETTMWLSMLVDPQLIIQTLRQIL